VMAAGIRFFFFGGGSNAHFRQDAEALILNSGQIYPYLAGSHSVRDRHPLHSELVV
jgi:hypothetical protein